jgi:hypothetical protein
MGQNFKPQYFHKHSGRTNRVYHAKQKTLMRWSFQSKHTENMMPKAFISLMLLLLTALITSCDQQGTASVSMLNEAYEVEPPLREFYEMIGGNEILGPAISPMSIRDNVKYQFVVCGLLVQDMKAPDIDRFHLSGLGLEMDIAEPPVPRPESGEGHYVDGHIIYEDFLPLYSQMGGARIVGRPITEMHYNPEKRRYEQYFENLGFYLMEDAPAEETKCLAYGAWKCDESCRQPPLVNSIVILPKQIGDKFVDAVARLGSNFTGFAITDTYLTPDGYTEQVFENVVLVSDPNQPSRVFLRSIAERLDSTPDPLVGPDDNSNFQFYEIQGNLGYNLPNHFMDYIAQHGGMESSGPPISELTQVKDYVYRQCFTNLCLEEHYSSSGEVTVRPAPMGYQYKMFPVLPVGEPLAPMVDEQPMVVQEKSDMQPLAPDPVLEQELEENQQSPNPGTEPESNSNLEEPQRPQTRELSVQVWETSPTVAPNQPQEIGVGVFVNNDPIQMVEPDLVVILPDGSRRTYYMLPTGTDGQTSIQLDPIDAPHNTVIPYEVCIYNIEESGKFCVRDSYLIMQNVE